MSTLTVSFESNAINIPLCFRAHVMPVGGDTEQFLNERANDWDPEKGFSNELHRLEDPYSFPRSVAGIVN